MARILSSLNVSSAVRLLNGSVGEIHTSVSRVISGNALETLLVHIRRKNFLNVLVLEHVQVEEITVETGSKKHLDVQFVGTINKILKHSDWVYIFV